MNMNKYINNICIVILYLVMLIAFTKITCAVYNYFNSSVMKMIALLIGSIFFTFISIILIKTISYLYIITKRKILKLI